MGEYATLNGERIKIGTCEDMLYLRADQAALVVPEPGNVDPVEDRLKLRFRFPFPDEDSTAPGAFADHAYALPVHGVTVPDGVSHSTVQFAARAGYLVSLPCPEGPGGAVKISQQRYLPGGVLATVCECGGCGAKYRLQTIEDARPIIDALRAEGTRRDNDPRSPGQTSQGDYHREVARRIEAGYAPAAPALAWNSAPT